METDCYLLIAHIATMIGNTVVRSSSMTPSHLLAISLFSLYRLIFFILAICNKDMTF